MANENLSASYVFVKEMMCSDIKSGKHEIRAHVQAQHCTLDKTSAGNRVGAVFSGLT